MMQDPLQQNYFKQTPQKANGGDYQAEIPQKLIDDANVTEEEFYKSRIDVISETVMESNRRFNMDSKVTPEDIYALFENIGHGRPFDKEIGEQLFDKLPQELVEFKGEKMFFKLRDFVDIYIKAEYLLLLQIRDTKRELQDYTEQLQQAQDSLDQGLRTEILNQYNLSINSSLYIKVIEAISDSKIFVPRSDCTYSASCVCNKYKYESEEVNVNPSQAFNPQFGWDFHIKIETGDEKLNIMLRENDPRGPGRVFKATFGLQNYSDQAEKEEWIRLMDEKNVYSKIQLHCLVQYKFSEAKFAQDEVKSIAELRDRLLENIAILERSLLSLVAPFVPDMNEQEAAAYNQRDSAY